MNFTMKSIKYVNKDNNKFCRSIIPGKSINAAFTMIELMISIALLASVMTISYTFYFFSANISNKGLDKISMQKTLRFNLEKICSDLRSAKEIVKIEPNMLEFKRFIDEKQQKPGINLFGDSEYRRIKYEYKKKGYNDKFDAIYETVDGQEQLMMYFPEIKEKIFEPYTFDSEDNLIAFDMRENDSVLRSKISLIKIRFEVKGPKESLTLTSSVNPRYLYGFKQQPYWNFIK
ncbi:MAG: prepilin-type N-terminal cleavage/methylation domain-containing protein [Candidatus Wallbacteria bacterium]